MTVIETKNLSKIYGESVTALQDVDLTVQEGEIYGFLGPNGAGKSTAINILLGFLEPTSGSAKLLGHDVESSSVSLREHIGVLPEGVTPYERLTGREHLELVKRIKGTDDDLDEILERVGLSSDDASRHAGQYSKGMAQRLNLAIALVGDPDLLILDEPSSGLDPTGITEMRKLLREEADDGTAVFFSSHILSEVEQVCDRVGILNNGELVTEDTIEGLRDSTGDQVSLRVKTAGDVQTAKTAVETVPTVDEVRIEDRDLHVTVSAEDKFDVLDACRNADVGVEDFDVDEASLEDLFKEYTGVQTQELKA